MKFKDWYNEEEHDLVNYPEESMEQAWDEQQKKIDMLAMFILRLLSERNVEREAKKYLIENDLIGSPLRELR